MASWRRGVLSLVQQPRELLVPVFFFFFQELWSGSFTIITKHSFLVFFFFKDDIIIELALVGQCKKPLLTYKSL